MTLPPSPSWLPFERFWNPPPTVAVVPLMGVIGRLSPWQRGMTLRSMAGILERAFGLTGLKAVALAVNSPGGAPVQAALIAARIRALAVEHEVPVIGFAEDVAASGGYWLLTAADEVYANASSIIGSIGVISAGFGFPEALKKLGVERRVYASGEHKGALDPFRPEQAEEVDHLMTVQKDIHEAFCQHVRERRGPKLKATEAALFNGRFWSGAQALGLGLIDGLGDLRTVMRDRYGDKVRLKLISDGRPWWQRWVGLRAHEATPFGRAAPAQSLMSGLAEEFLWHRYRL